MKKYYCDRCGNEIAGKEAMFVSPVTIDGLYGDVVKKDFCSRCKKEITEFLKKK